MIASEDNTRIIKISEEATLIEQKPGYRTIIEYGGVKFRLFFPYMIFVIRSWKSARTLHFGLRTEPISEGNIIEERVIFPPLPHIYNKWLLCCSPNTIQGFWGTSFVFGDNWLGCHSLLSSPISIKKIHNYAGHVLAYQRWASLKPEECMDIFEKWPKEIEGQRVGDIWIKRGEEGCLSLEYTISNMLGNVHPQAVHHVTEISKDWHQ